MEIFKTNEKLFDETENKKETKDIERINYSLSKNLIEYFVERFKIKKFMLFVLMFLFFWYIFIFNFTLILDDK